MPPMSDDDQLRHWMRRALELAHRGRGAVEPNPQVGCLIIQHDQIIGEGWHRTYGGPHAEIEAIAQAGTQADGAICVVTLEPCCHVGKTPPCTAGLISAGVRHVVIGCLDPNPQVAGKGVEILKQAGVDVTLGILEDDCLELISPYAKLIKQGTPWVIAKWAMTLDGHIATHTGDSQWVSNQASRAKVHELRGVVDAVVVGIETALADDSLLTARPPGPRTATRVILDRQARLPLDSRLVQTAAETPVLIATGPNADAGRLAALSNSGCEIWRGDSADPLQLWQDLLSEMGRRQWTNVLVEGGSRVLGTCFDAETVDEVHVFIATKIIGGQTAPPAVGGTGLAMMAQARPLRQLRYSQLGDDLYVTGRVAAKTATAEDTAASLG